MTKSVTAGDKELHFKFTKQAIVNFSKKTGKKLEEGIDLEDTAELCLQALIVGHKLNDKVCNLTIDEVWELDNKYDIIDKMMETFTDDEKKPEASSQE